MKTIQIRTQDILKIKKTDDAVIVYTQNKCYVCIKEQQTPKREDFFTTLYLRGKRDV